MSILCLNCWGLGKPRVGTNLQRIFGGCNPSLLLLLETKRSVAKIREFVDQFDDFIGVYVDCRGRSGGLAMFWKKNLDAHRLSYATTILTSLSNGSRIVVNGGLRVYMDS